MAELERRRRSRQRLIATWQADPLLIAQSAGFTPDPWQERVLLSQSQAILLNCSRQSGKSTVLALRIVAEILKPEAMVVIVAPSERQSKELMRKVLAFWRKVGRPIKAIAAAKTSLELENGARIEAFPSSSDTVRGISAVTLLVPDEAAIVPDELYNSLAPMLAVANGRLLAPSTPKGKRGWWWGMWDTPPQADPDIERVEVPATQCPRIPAAFLERERRRAGEWWYLQEYDCQFLDNEMAAFRSSDIEASFTDGVRFDAELFA